MQPVLKGGGVGDADVPGCLSDGSVDTLLLADDFVIQERTLRGMVLSEDVLDTLVGSQRFHFFD